MISKEEFFELANQVIEHEPTEAEKSFTLLIDSMRHKWRNTTIGFVVCALVFTLSLSLLSIVSIMVLGILLFSLLIISGGLLLVVYIPRFIGEWKEMGWNIEATKRWNEKWLPSKSLEKTQGHKVIE